MPASTRERRGPIGPRLATLTAAGALCLGPAAHAVQPSSPPPANANAKENASTTPSIAPGPFTLQSADEGIGLSAVFTLPEGDGPFPAAVLINSAGPQDTAGTVFDRPIARLIADHLARLGIASVRFADRGTDGSDGRFGATLDDVALDAAGGLAFLKAHDRIDADRVAYIGYGDGGLAAIKAAMRADRPAALVLLCTPAAPGGEVLSDHQARLLAAGGVEAEAVDAVVKAQRALVEAIRADDGRQALGDRVTDLLGAQYRAQFGRDIPPEVVLHTVRRGLDQARSAAASIWRTRPTGRRGWRCRGSLPSRCQPRSGSCRWQPGRPTSGACGSRCWPSSAAETSRVRSSSTPCAWPRRSAPRRATRAS